MHAVGIVWAAAEAMVPWNFDVAGVVSGGVAGGLADGVVFGRHR